MMGGCKAFGGGVQMGVMGLGVGYRIFIGSKLLVLGARLETGYLGIVLTCPSVLDANRVANV
jgi:hypothetical protein